MSSFWQFFSANGNLKKKKKKFLANFLKNMSSFWQFFYIQMAIFRRVSFPYQLFSSPLKLRITIFVFQVNSLVLFSIEESQLFLLLFFFSNQLLSSPLKLMKNLNCFCCFFKSTLEFSIEAENHNCLLTSLSTEADGDGEAVEASPNPTC